MSKPELPISDGDNFKATYENYEMACPNCKEWNIFNRITDIRSIGAACGKKVRCLFCGEEFQIVDDNVEEKYEYFLEDYEDLLLQKKYMYCIITLCQACEAFFMKCIDIKLLWEPYRRSVFGVDDMKFRLFEEYHEKIDKYFKHFPYWSLLNVFFDLYLNSRSFGTQDEIMTYLKKVSEFSGNAPSKDEIRTKCKDRRAKALLALKRLDIHEIRNKIAHKDGYRPTREEVEHYNAQVIAILNDIVEVFELGEILKYCDISNMMESIRK